MERITSRALYKADLFEASKEERPALFSDNGTQLTAKSFKNFLNTWDIERMYVRERYESFYEAKDDIDNFIEHYAKNQAASRDRVRYTRGQIHRKS